MTHRSHRVTLRLVGSVAALLLGAPPMVQALPAWKAFVVHFSRDPSGLATSFSGRVEHLSSGRRVRCESPGQWLTVLVRLLGEVEDTAQ